VHLYHAGKKTTDEIYMETEGPPGAPMNLINLQQSFLPHPIVVLSESMGLPALSAYETYRPFPDAPPRPAKHTLPVQEHLCGGAKCGHHGLLNEPQPRFQIRFTLTEEVTEVEMPEIPEEKTGKKGRKKKIKKKEVEEEVEPCKEEKKWELETSHVFAQRMQEADGHALFDTRRVRTLSFERDWVRCSSKRSFTQVMLHHGSEAEEVGKVYTCLHQHYDLACQAYRYYSIVGGGDDAAMRLGQYTNFIDDCGIVDKVHCKLSDCDVIFIQCNFDEEQQLDTERLAAVKPDELMLMRCDFLEALIRLAKARYGKRRNTGGTLGEASSREMEIRTSDALHMLMTKNVAPHLCPEATLNCDEFRKNRLYTKEMESLCADHLPILRALHRCYSGTLGRLHVSQILELLQHADVLEMQRGSGIKLNKRDVYCCFNWSRMMVCDELRGRRKFASLGFVDFIEFLGRVADLVCAPTPEDLEAYGCKGGTLAEYVAMVSGEHGRAQLPQRPSGILQALKTRALQEKMQPLLDFMLSGLCLHYGFKEDHTEQLIALLNHTKT
ncbi:hypothetical protein CYMTET_2970, partial [Cymbomonas tetramitiformis]